MENSTILFEPISKNIFEKYLQIIEKIRNELQDEEIVPDENVQDLLKKDIELLDKIVNAIERTLQDINSNQNVELIDEINELVVECLNSWILILVSWSKAYNIIESLSYNYIGVLNLLLYYKIEVHVDFVRYIGKLTSGIDDSNLAQHYINEERNIRIEEEVISGLNAQELEQYIINLKKEISDSTSYRDIDPLNFSGFLQAEVSYLAYPAIKRFENDSLRLKRIYEIIFFEFDIEKIRDIVSDPEILIPFEDLFNFDDQKEICTWEIKFTINNEHDYYRASEIGFLLWSFAKALETIDGLEVELKEWGNGSKFFTLFAKIFNLGSKVDLKQVLTKSRQIVEVAYTKHPLDELQKFEAEKEKLKVEAFKISKESDNIMDSDQAKISHELEIQNKILDLQKKEIDIENSKADVLLKNLQAIDKMSELISKGIIQNDSDVQILINKSLYFSKQDNKISYDNINYIDIKERIEDKESPDNLL